MASTHNTGLTDSGDSGLFPALLLLAFTVLFFVNLIPVKRARKDADKAGITINSDQDLLRSQALLSGDRVVYTYILNNIPQQTPVSIPYDKRHVERVQRFWLALLPDYPIQSDAGLRIISNDVVPAGATVLARGSLLALVDARTGSGE